MRQQLENRLTELKGEFETGQRQLIGLEEQSRALRQTLFRIAGAIQVLEEELAKDSGSECGDARKFG